MTMPTHDNLPVTNDGISFHWERDGDKNNRTQYVIARHDEWPDEMRLDFDTRHTAGMACTRLRAGQITMAQAQAESSHKWL